MPAVGTLNVRQVWTLYVQKAWTPHSAGQDVRRSARALAHVRGFFGALRLSKGGLSVRWLATTSMQRVSTCVVLTLLAPLMRTLSTSPREVAPLRAALLDAYLADGLDVLHAARLDVRRADARDVPHADVLAPVLDFPRGARLDVRHAKALDVWSDILMRSLRVRLARFCGHLILGLAPPFSGWAGKPGCSRIFSRPPSSCCGSSCRASRLASCGRS